MIRDVAVHELRLLRRHILDDFEAVLVVDLHIAVHDARGQRIGPAELHIIGDENELRVLLESIDRILLDILVRLDVARLGLQLLLKARGLLLSLIRDAGQAVQCIGIALKTCVKIILEELRHILVIILSYQRGVLIGTSVAVGNAGRCTLIISRRVFKFRRAGHRQPTILYIRILRIPIQNQNEDDQYDHQCRNTQETKHLMKLLLLLTFPHIRDATRTLALDHALDWFFLQCLIDIIQIF